MALRRYQEQALHDVGEHFNAGARSVCLVMPTGCHAAGQPVLRHDGTIVPVEDVRVGEALMGPDSQPRRVLRLIRGHDELFRVVPVKGEPFTATREHVLTLVRTNTGDDDRAGELIDVTLDDWMAWPAWRKHIHKLLRVAVDFPKREGRLPLDPYFLGVLLGDGSMSRVVSITKPDPEIHELCEHQAALHGLRVNTTGEGTSTAYNLTQGHCGGLPNPIMTKLDSLGLRNADSATKFVPHAYLTTSRFQRLSILAGLIDTDGSLSRAGYDFISKSERLSADVTFLARSVGLAAYITPCRKGCQTGAVGTYYRVSISGNADIIPCRIPRKQAPPRRQVKDVLRTGFRVEPIDNGAFYGFTLDGDGRYLLGDFTVTHNSGKTYTGSTWLTGNSGIRNAPARHNDTGLWIVHRIELVRDAIEQLDAILPNQVAIIRSGTNTEDFLRQPARIYVSTIQSLLASGQRPDVSRIIADECHHFAPGNEWTDFLSLYPNAKILGLTATPERADGRGLGDIFQQMIVGARYPELVQAGHLVPCRAFAPPEAIDRGVANDPVAMYQKHGEGAQGFLFSGSIADAELWAERFSEAGIRSVAVHQRLSERVRLQVMEEFQAGRIRILTNVFVLTEGVNVPAARVCILAKSVRHTSQYLQIAGRVLRPSPGKPDAILLDLCGSVLEHGLPTEDRTYSLEGRAISRTVASVRQCPQCGAVHDGAPAQCDLCGYVFPVAAQAEAPPPRIYDMELRQVYAGGATPEPARKREFDRLIQVATDRDYSLSWVVKQYERLFHDKPAAFLAELPEEVKRREHDKLAALQRERGYKPGFVAVRWKELFGAWPPRAWAQGPAMTPAAPKRPPFIPWLTAQPHGLAQVVQDCTRSGCLERRLADARRDQSEAAILFAHLNEDHDGLRSADVEAAVNDYRREFLPDTVAPGAPSLEDSDVPF